MNLFKTRQILKQIFLNMSDFKRNFLQPVRFCFKVFFKNSDFEKKYALKNHFLTEFTPLNARILHFWSLQKRKILTQKIFVKIRYFSKNFSTFQILK